MCQDNETHNYIKNMPVVLCKRMASSMLIYCFILIAWYYKQVKALIRRGVCKILIFEVEILKNVKLW